MANTVLFQHPKKWRDTCDLFALNFHAFHPIEIIGYPHAGNDVFHVKGTYEGKEITAYVKAARQEGAGIENEVVILKQLDLPYNDQPPTHCILLMVHNHTSATLRFIQLCKAGICTIKP